jgi:hypothetical protein
MGNIPGWANTSIVRVAATFVTKAQRDHRLGWLQITLNHVTLQVGQINRIRQHAPISARFG